MKARGFTLLELVIVLVLIGITAVFGTRFIADMATSYTGSAERAQALAGARFALERIKRELSQAYSPSVYFSDDKRCLSFVPVLASGKYAGDVTDQATFIIPTALEHQEPEPTYMAIRADSGEEHWKDYPATRPAHLFALLDPAAIAGGYRVPMAELIGEGLHFDINSLDSRFTLLAARQTRYCLESGSLWRQQREAGEWSEKILMLTQVTSDSVFMDYDESLQLLKMELSVHSRDGILVLPGQFMVVYEP